MRLGEIIYNFRSEKQISMREFAKMLGIGKLYVYMLEANKNSRDGKTINPSVNTLQKIACAVNIPLNDLLRMLDGYHIIKLNFTTENYDEIKLLKGYCELSYESKMIKINRTA